MLSKTDNALLTRVGPGTPMGDLLRLYWVPALSRDELPEPDGAPLRVRLLGEDLIAFRATDGTVGLVGDHCPHRGASLFFGRNEEDGLRCVYHGWKFDAAGACVDMPNEPPESNFKDKIRLTAYPVVERNGVGWVYMGPQNPPPPLPDLEWNLVPEEQVYLTKRVQESNWVQVLEGEIDSSHSGFLHTVLDEEANYRRSMEATDEYRLFGSQSKGMLYKMRDKHPHFAVVDTDYGVLIGARRDAEADSYYWRITQFLFPFHTLIPPYGPDPLFNGHAWIPIDDQRTLALCFTYHPLRPLKEAELKTLRHGEGALGHQGLHPTVDAFRPWSGEAWGQYYAVYHRGNDYQCDWELQRRERFSGLPGVWPQDAACQDSMGRIYDRSSEHLGTSDTGIIRTRRALMGAAKALQDRGVLPPSVTDPAVYRIRSASVVLPRSTHWVEGSAPIREARPDVNFAAV